MDMTAARESWHDVVCPEGPECRDRELHAMSEPVYTSGKLQQFVDLYESRTTGSQSLENEVCPVCGAKVHYIDRFPQGRRVCVNGDVWHIIDGNVHIVAKVRMVDSDEQ